MRAACVWPAASTAVRRTMLPGAASTTGPVAAGRGPAQRTGRPASPDTAGRPCGAGAKPNRPENRRSTEARSRRRAFAVRRSGRRLRSGGLRLGGRRLRRLLLGRLLRRRLLLGGGRRLRLRAVLAVGRLEALAAARLGLPALAVVLAELVERLALAVALQDLLDRRLGLRERLLLRLGDLRDLEDVVAELRLHRTGELALLRVEDRGVERLLLLALGDAGEQTALGLRCLVDRVLLRDALPRLAGLQRALGLLRAG